MPHDVFGADEQAVFPIDVAFGAGSRLVVEEEQVPETTELSVLFVDEQAMSDLNERFLGGTGPTDVLAFPMDDDVVLGGRQPDQGGRGPGAPTEPGDPPTLLGDVVVCPAVADRQAGLAGGTFDDEVGLLVVHGVLHLLNYDHAEPQESETMKRRERELLTRFRALERNGEQAPT